MADNETRLEQLKLFYVANGENDRGFTLKALWGKPDNWLERSHMFIQWMFPLPTPSRGNIYAPLLDEDAIIFFHDSAQAQDNLVKSFLRFCQLLGLQVVDSKHGPQVIKGERFALRKEDWFTIKSHTDSRITRVLTSLTLLGRSDLAHALLAGLKMLMQDEDDCVITAYSVIKWENAVKALP